MKIIIGSEGKGIWGKLIIDFFLKKLGYTDIVYNNTDNCNIILSSHFNKIEPNWNNQKKKYIYWSGESYIPRKNNNQKDGLYILTTYSMMNNLLYLPYCLYSPYLYLDRKYPNKDRKYSIAYCSSNKIPIREDIFNVFVWRMGIDQCHSLGTNYGSYPQTNRKVEGNWENIELIERYKDYKFVLAMENANIDGYVTEKIINAFYSGAIPIYWGSKKVLEFFNPKAFIYVNNFPTLSHCVHYVDSLKQEDIDKMLSEPIYNPDNEIINLLNNDYEKNKTLENYLTTIKQFIN
tara:strand:- start:4007 stop:4879 length:873 start_codon:yes stop_codon:yes gene_type:complete